jgi:predicted AAA+ superfamily ATPase
MLNKKGIFMIKIFQNRFYNLINNLNFSYKRYLFKKIDFSEKLIGIIGARGVGKTTLLLQYLKENDLPLNKKLYINAEFLEYSNLKLYDFAEEFEKKGGILLVIDEIHKYPNFEKELKLIYDTLNLKVIFTGSSAIKLEHSKGDLSRRSIIYKMNNLSFREFLEFKTGYKFNSFPLEELIKNHLDIVFEITSKIKPFEFFDEYLKFGAYPFYFENKNNYYFKLQESVNATIEFDLPFIFDIKPINTIKLKKLVYLICESEPFELNITKLAQKIEINRNTLYQYLYYLAKGDIFILLDSKTRGDNIFVKPQKIYLKNTNLNYCYCEEQKIGTIRETFFANQLFEYNLLYPKNGDFLVNEKYIFEIGGKNKTKKQIKNIENSYLVLDDIEFGNENIIPLYLFGFLY